MKTKESNMVGEGARWGSRITIGQARPSSLDLPMSGSRLLSLCDSLYADDSPGGRGDLSRIEPWLLKTENGADLAAIGLISLFERVFWTTPVATFLRSGLGSRPGGRPGPHQQRNLREIGGRNVLPRDGCEPRIDWT